MRCFFWSVLLLVSTVIAHAQTSVSFGLRGAVCQRFGWRNPDFLNSSYRMLGQAAFARLERGSGWAFELDVQHSFREGNWESEEWNGCFGPPYTTINLSRHNEHIYTVSLGAQHRLFSTHRHKAQSLPLVQGFGGIALAASRTAYNSERHSESDGIYTFLTDQSQSHVSVMPGITGTLTCNPGRHLQASLEMSYLADLSSMNNLELVRQRIREQRLGLALGIAYRF